ncbi:MULTISPECIES: LuxR family transcriptional regulator [unclassified Rhizobium]|uniref:LuxR family transcriptional regulator n=1 Tax=unclassified Rhizobium TaxID=2613769 RepID=UPI0016035258|nr:MULTISPECIES: LuxR family transcriptional regulator [unclassified Rhizobium]MBB1248033.1 LuxR family transcriptional regulator [Rhizobium sp. G21]MCV3765333.1 LuxR family transcriptional regulator [Rhizobium sp. TRM95796]
MRSIIANMMFDVIDRLDKMSSEEQAFAELRKVADFFGLNAFAISGIPEPHEKMDPYVLLNGWPSEWAARYLERQYFRIDPVIQRTLLSDNAFVWSDALDPASVDKRSLDFMGEARDFKFIDGFSVPIHSIMGFRAIVTYAAEKVDMPQEGRSALHMISIYAHNKIKELKSGNKPQLIKRSIQLTPRERECISWCSEGKTAWEISTILGISERTVSHILENAQRKMNTTNRVQLVAEALRAGLIK